MGERTGIITFLNVYDEISDDGHSYSGCLASVVGDDGRETLLDTTSDRLIHALETFYAIKARATVDFTDAEVAAPTYGVLQKRRAQAQEISRAAEGPFILRAIWSSLSNPTLGQLNPLSSYRPAL
jgi:hypothetical protein